MTTKKDCSSILCSKNPGSSKLGHPLQSPDYRQLYYQLSISNSLAKSRDGVSVEPIMRRPASPPKQYQVTRIPSLSLPSPPTSPPPVITLSMPTSPSPDLDFTGEPGTTGRSAFLTVPGVQDDACVKARAPNRPEEDVSISRPLSRRSWRDDEFTTADEWSDHTDHLAAVETAFRRAKLSEMLLQHQNYSAALIRQGSRESSRSVPPSAHTPSVSPFPRSRSNTDRIASPGRTAQLRPVTRAKSPLVCAKPARHSGLCTYMEAEREFLRQSSVEYIEEQRILPTKWPQSATPTKWQRHGDFGLEESGDEIRLCKYRLTPKKKKKRRETGKGMVSTHHSTKNEQNSDSLTSTGRTDAPNGAKSQVPKLPALMIPQKKSSGVLEKRRHGPYT